MNLTDNFLIFIGIFRKKSVDDLLATSQDVINTGISQALSTATALSTTASSLSLNRDRRRSPSPSSRSVNIPTSPRNSSSLFIKSNKSETQLSPSNSKLDNIEVIFFHDSFYFKNGLNLNSLFFAWNIEYCNVAWFFIFFIYAVFNNSGCPFFNSFFISGFYHIFNLKLLFF